MFAARRAIRPAATEFRAAVNMEFGAGSARARVARRPPEVVLLSKANDLMGRYADFFLPDAERFIVFLLHRHPNAIRSKF